MKEAAQVRAWAWWPLRVIALIQAVVIFDQAVFAGQFLSGEFGALARHGHNATNAGLATIAMIVAAVLLRCPGGGPMWPMLACTGLFGLIALQIAMGYARVLTVHIPLGVSIITASMFVLVRAWRPVLIRPASAKIVQERLVSGAVSGGIPRRTVLGLLGAAAVAGVGVPLLGGLFGASSTGVLLTSQRPLPRPFTRPLMVPPVLAPTERTATTDFYEIIQRLASVQLLDDVLTPIWGYNGTFPGPTIAARRGRRVVVRHRNELPMPTVVHLHGGHTSPEHDGFPIDLLLPVGSDSLMGHSPHLARGAISHGEREYLYPSEQRAATLWYHDHRMDFTGPAVWRGLAGFHLIGDDEEDALGLPQGERDLPLMIADRSFAADGTLRYPSLDPGLIHMAGVEAPYAPGVLGDVVLVNGVPWPVAAVSAVRYRLRLLNAANARRFRLALDPAPPGGGALVQIGTDGGLLDRPLPHDAIELAPAQRFDVVVDFGRYEPGQEVTLVNEFGDGPTAQVMRLRVGSRDADSSRVPDVLSSVAPLDPGRVDVTRTFAFRTGSVGAMTGWTINGQPFDPDRADASPRLGEVEVWRLVSDFHHPFHLHLSPFQVLSRGAGGPEPYDAGWKDTLDLRPSEQATVITRFTGFAGRYVFHCHNLEHEDMAMMGTLVTRE